LEQTQYRQVDVSNDPATPWTSGLTEVNQLVDDVVESSTRTSKPLIYKEFLVPVTPTLLSTAGRFSEGKKGRARTSIRPDIDKSTVALEVTSSASLHSISLIERSLGRSGYEVGIFCTAMTVSTDRSGERRRYLSSA
jgi:hypothetical protein